MEDDYKAFRHYLKSLDKTSLRKLCSLAGFNESEMLFIVPFFGCGKSEDFIADNLVNQSVDAFHKNKRKYIRRLQHFCHQIYLPENTPYAERMRILDEYIRSH